MTDDDGRLGETGDKRRHVERVVGDALPRELRIGRTRRTRDVEGQVGRLAIPAVRREDRHDVGEAPAAAESAVNENDGLGHVLFPDQGGSVPPGGYDFTPDLYPEKSRASMISRLNARGMDESEGLRGGECREAFLFFERHYCRPAQDLSAYPQRFSGFPLPDSHRVGAASLG
jgi:hypothetical protein